MSDLIIIPHPHFRDSTKNDLLSKELVIEDDDQRKVFCLSCSLPLTRLCYRYYYHGNNCFTFKNPVGMVFEVMLFINVENVLTIGKPESYFSWFEGCCWQILICSCCQNHLGWLFSGKEFFYALIRSKIYLENGR